MDQLIAARSLSHLVLLELLILRVVGGQLQSAQRAGVGLQVDTQRAGRSQWGQRSAERRAGRCGDVLTLLSHGRMQDEWKRCLQGIWRSFSFFWNFSRHTGHLTPLSEAETCHRETSASENIKGRGLMFQIFMFQIFNEFSYCCRKFCSFFRSTRYRDMNKNG